MQATELFELMMTAQTPVEVNVCGESMLPALRPDADTVILEPLKSSPSKGDIVLAKTDEGGIVLHRVVNVNDGFVSLMGDHNRIKIEQCKASDVVARVSYVKRNNRILPSPPLSCLLRLPFLRRIFLTIYDFSKQY